MPKLQTVPDADQVADLASGVTKAGRAFHVWAALLACLLMLVGVICVPAGIGMANDASQRGASVAPGVGLAVNGGLAIVGGLAFLAFSAYVRTSAEILAKLSRNTPNDRAPRP